jgi:hypothetical protein
MGRSPYTRTRPPDLSGLPRCEAWTPPRSGQPAHPCPNAGPYERDGHRVCMMHRNSPYVAFSAAAARHLIRRR